MLLPIDLNNLTIGTTVGGLILIQGYTKQLNTQSKAPVNGTAVYQGKTVTFKVWQGVAQDILNTGDYTGMIAAVTGKVTEYRDNLDLTIDTINFNHGITDKALFYKSVDTQQVWSNVQTFLNSNMNSEGMPVLNAIFSVEGVMQKFQTTWAGAKMHDAQVGGLMNHTYKMLRIAETLIMNDKRLEPMKDLLYLSILVHDIGKIKEITDGGVYTPLSFVGHRTFGIELLVPLKETIVQSYNEEFYYEVLAVVQGHHGKEYGDAPTSIMSQIVAYIDMLESQTTGFLDRIEVEDVRVATDKHVYHDGNRLHVYNYGKVLGEENVPVLNPNMTQPYNGNLNGN